MDEPIEDRRGDESEFWAEFARLHGRDLERCIAKAMRGVGWRPAAGEVEELLQELYCRLLERGASASLRDRPTGQVWAYLHRTARSVVVDQLRNRAARKRGGPNRCDERPEVLLRRQAPGPSAEERLLVREHAAQVRRRICELGGAEHGPRNLRILELAAVEGCTAAEIARRLHGVLSPSTVHTVLHRLRRQLAVDDAGVSS